MRIRSTGLALLAGLSIFVAACSSGGAHGPVDGAHRAPTPAAPRPPHPRIRRRRPRPRRKSDLKIGVVTDIGTLDDKNYNEYTYKGARPARPAIGAADAAGRRPEGRVRVRDAHPGVRRPEVQHHRHGRLQPRPARPASAVKATRASGSSASTSRRSASTRRARRTSRSRCPGDVPTVAAELHLDRLPGRPGGLSRRDHRRVGQQDRHDRRHRRHDPVRPCMRYIQGYALGAKSVNPTIEVMTAYVTTTTSRTPRSTTRSLARSSPDVHHPEQGSTSCSRSPARPATASSMPPARPTSTASASTSTRRSRYPNAAKCTVTSAEKHLQMRDDAIQRSRRSQGRPRSSTPSPGRRRFARSTTRHR